MHMSAEVMLNHIFAGTEKSVFHLSITLGALLIVEASVERSMVLGKEGRNIYQFMFIKGRHESIREFE